MGATNVIDQLHAVSSLCANATDPDVLDAEARLLLVALAGSSAAAAVADELVASSRSRLRAVAELRDLVSRVDSAQHLANMGDYDWHIATDTLVWSDQLFRIYGYEPGATSPTYATFLAHIHPDDRDRVATIHEDAHRTGAPYTMVERIVRNDGEVRHLLSNGEVIRDDEGTPLRLRGTCIDITERVVAELAHEEGMVAEREDQERRRQALELNDGVVQGLVAASYALADGDATGAQTYVDHTLGAARGMMDDLLARRDGSRIEAGDLVRSRPPSLGGSPDPTPLSEPAESPRHRVLVVDDSEDLRHVFRLTLEMRGAYRVVGEAADGAEAVELATSLQPDLILLDLAMPRMDGLQALPLLREAVRDVRIVVLSGFNESTMADRALAVGADRYVVKGGSMRALVGVCDEVVGAP